MRGGAHSNYQPDQAKREQWLAEMAARPEVNADDLLGLFNNPEFIERVDAEQKRLQQESIASLVGFTALDGATKDETRLLQIARSNVALYDDEIEDVIYKDPVMHGLIDKDVRDTYRSSEDYSAAVRLRRTIVAYYFVFDSYVNAPTEEIPPVDLQAG